jgi:hypothetical protein
MGRFFFEFSVTIYMSCNSSYKKVVALDFNLPVQHLILDF